MKGAMPGNGQGASTWTGQAQAPQTHVPLARLTTLRVGGTAEWYAAASRPDDVEAYVAWSLDRGVALTVLGGGSNVVVADRGLDGLVLQVGLRGVSLEPVGDAVRLTAGAGEPWDDVVALSVAQGLGGMECLSGIPGRVGGTPIQNIGAYGQDVAGVLERVVAFDRVQRAMTVLAAADCGFAYRSSRFKGPGAGRFIVCHVAFRLARTCAEPTYPDLRAQLEAAGRGTSPTASHVRNAVLRLRRTKGMVIDTADTDTRSVGSFFMNPVLTPGDRDRVARVAGGEPPSYPAGEGRVKLPAAWLIERAGFVKGFEDGAVGLSAKHALAIVNRGGATARDVVRLAVRIKKGVGDRFGVALMAEPVFLGFDDDPDVAFLRKASH
jgi:UDP-N-acetylmuramate dehydrogenase